MNNIHTILEVWGFQRAHTYTHTHTHTYMFLHWNTQTPTLAWEWWYISVACQQIYHAYKYILTPQARHVFSRLMWMYVRFCFICFFLYVRAASFACYFIIVRRNIHAQACTHTDTRVCARLTFVSLLYTGPLFFLTTSCMSWGMMHSSASAHWGTKAQILTRLLVQKYKYCGL